MLRGVPKPGEAPGLQPFGAFEADTNSNAA